MQRRVGAFFLVACLSVPFQNAAAANLPEIKAGPSNRVPECATPGRMMAYLRSRNPDINARFEGVATEYMRLGEDLGVRWDYAFYQMIIETGSLSYRRGNRAGDVKPTQNNFAGLGATGGGETGESFKDIASGVRAHLEHLLLYSGQKLENPVAERTRKVQEWGVLTSWQAGFKRPITFSDLAAKWAPGTRTYVTMLEAVAERFDEFCAKADPRPELVQEARGNKGRGAAAEVRTADAKTSAAEAKVAEAIAERPSGTDLARQAIEHSKSRGGEQRSALGAQQATKPPMPFKVLNAPPPAAEPDQQVAPALAEAAPKMIETASTKPAEPIAKAKEPDLKSKAPQTKQADKPPMQVASAAGAAKSLATPPAASGSVQKCRVWTASYGGQKAMIIKSLIGKVVNYTVLDVNEGAEAREADAFIAAYAKGGAIAGEFASQSQALDKAFELCPEG